MTAGAAGAAGAVFGRFEAARPNELWTGDALHGPHVGGRKTYLSEVSQFAGGDLEGCVDRRHVRPGA